MVKVNIVQYVWSENYAIESIPPNIFQQLHCMYPACPTTLVLTAIYFFTPAVFKAFDEIKPIDPKGTGEPEYLPPTVINWMVGQGYYFSESEVTGWWKDAGKPDDLLGVNAFALEKKESFSQKGILKDTTFTGTVEHGKGSKIESSVIRGPVAIGSDCHIKNCYTILELYWTIHFN